MLNKKYKCFILLLFLDLYSEKRVTFDFFLVGPVEVKEREEIEIKENLEAVNYTTYECVKSNTCYSQLTNFNDNEYVCHDNSKRSLGTLSEVSKKAYHKSISSFCAASFSFLI